MDTNILSAVIAGLVAIIVAAVGWIIERRRSLKTSDSAEIRRRVDLENVNKKLDSLEGIQKQLDELKSQTSALEEANRLYAEANPQDKDPWGDAEWTGSGGLFVIKHTGVRDVVIDSVRAKEAEAGGLFTLRYPSEDELPATFHTGQTIDFLTFDTGVTAAPSALIKWHWVGSSEIRETERRAHKPR